MPDGGVVIPAILYTHTPNENVKETAGRIDNLEELLKKKMKIRRKKTSFHESPVHAKKKE